MKDFSLSEFKLFFNIFFKSKLQEISWYKVFHSC